MSKAVHPKPSAHVDKENASGTGKKPSTPGRKPPASPSRNPDLMATTTGPLVVDEIDTLPAAQLSAAPLPDVAAAPSGLSSSGFVEAEVQTAIDLTVDERSVATLQEKLWEMTTLYKVRSPRLFFLLLFWVNACPLESSSTVCSFADDPTCA